MKQQRIQELISLFVSGEISGDEQEELSALIVEHPEIQSDLDEALEVWNLLGEDAVSFQPEESAAWEKIQNRIESDSVVPDSVVQARFKRRGVYLWMAVAAAVSLLVTFAYFNWAGDSAATIQGVLASSDQDQPSQVHEITFTARDKNISFYLPDSSLVQLNQHSTLTVSDSFSFAERIIFLEGEAFFEVTHDENHPFIVITEHTRTKVLGTSFNVRAYREETRKVVTVETGAVLFKPTDEGVVDSLYLYKSDQGVYDLNISSLVKEPGDTPGLLGWRSNDKVLEGEMRSPTKYLVPEYDVKAKVIAPSVVRIEVVNEARFASFRNVQILIRYTAKKGEREAIFDMEGNVAPGDRIKGKFKLKDWFRKSKLLDISIKNAEGFQHK